jgi:uncharacterized Zn-finger protein
MTQAESHQTQQDIHKVTYNDLPLCCPRPGEDVAIWHPRVYLSIEKSGYAVCPYCGARYQLSE